MTPADPAQAEREFQEAMRLLRLVEPAAVVDEIVLRHARAVLAASCAPGNWQCDACGFVLHKRLMRASDGAVGIDTSEIEEPCPNDGNPLRPLKWEEMFRALEKVIETVPRRVLAARIETAVEAATAFSGVSGSHSVTLNEIVYRLRCELAAMEAGDGD